VPANRRDSWRLHRVQEGETFAALSKRYNAQVAALSSANHDAFPVAGEWAAVPVGYAGDRVAKPAAPRRRTDVCGQTVVLQSFGRQGGFGQGRFQQDAFQHHIGQSQTCDLHSEQSDVPEGDILKWRVAKKHGSKGCDHGRQEARVGAAQIDRQGCGTSQTIADSARRLIFGSTERAANAPPSGTFRLP
jgi:hypothetical protein